VEILDHSVNWNLSRCWSTGGSTEAKILIASLRASFFKHGALSRLTQIVEKLSMEDHQQEVKLVWKE
jgi:hypothetical protein